MSDYLVIKLDPCEECGGTGKIESGTWARYQRAIDEGADPNQAAIEHYHWIDLSYAPSPEEAQELSKRDCVTCEGKGGLRSEVSLSEALDAMGR